jgi:hypothetical protein
VADLNLDEIGEYCKHRLIIVYLQYHSSLLVCPLFVKAIAARCPIHSFVGATTELKFMEFADLKASSGL